MPAYMIVQARISDRARFINDYGGPAAALIERFGGRYLVRAPGGVVLEGDDWAEGCSVVVSEWPDLAAIRRFWDSPEYADVKKLRDGLAEVRVMAVEQPAAR